MVNKLAKVHLPTAIRMCQRQVSFGRCLHHKLLFADIFLHAGIAATKTQLIPQPVINPLYGMSLLAWNLPVSLQPWKSIKGYFTEILLCKTHPHSYDSGAFSSVHQSYAGGAVSSPLHLHLILSISPPSSLRTCDICKSRSWRQDHSE